MSDPHLIFNPPPGWPKPPPSWRPPPNWKPDPSWPAIPEGWQLWIENGTTQGASQEGTDASNNKAGFTDKVEEKLSASFEVDESLNDVNLRHENKRLRAELRALRNRELPHLSDEEWVELNDQRVLQSAGIYRYHHPLENASAYRAQLRQLNTDIKECIQANEAILTSSLFSFENSLAQGRKMSADLSKLMLRAYNAEADNIIRSLRAGNVDAAKKRLESMRRSIANLGKMMEMQISDKFHQLRLNEIELTSDWLMKKQEEREAAREERARLREQRRVEKELAAQREKLEKERSHIMNALETLRVQGASDGELEAKLKEIDGAIEDNDYRAANIRAGYVYVISNRGAFGSGVVKIGLTRRLEPLERINELGGASVPFRFDVHVLYFSEDAVTLENELHAHFADRALNRANVRKEFFFATPAEVRAVLEQKVGNLLEFKVDIDADEYYQSLNQWPENVRKVWETL